MKIWDAIRHEEEHPARKMVVWVPFCRWRQHRQHSVTPSLFSEGYARCSLVSRTSRAWMPADYPMFRSSSPDAITARCRPRFRWLHRADHDVVRDSRAGSIGASAPKSICQRLPLEMRTEDLLSRSGHLSCSTRTGASGLCPVDRSTLPKQRSQCGRCRSRDQADALVALERMLLVPRGQCPVPANHGRLIEPPIGLP